MTQMSMNKAIHGAIRRDLDRFVSALSSFPAGDRRRAQQLATAWACFDNELTRHHEGEHTIAWPALAAVGVSQQVLDAMDAEHDRMAEALASARVTMADLARTAGADEAATALTSIQSLKSVTIAHLEHEDAELEPVYAAKHDTPEMKAMGRAFSKVSPTVAGQFFAWVLEGASPEEREAASRNIPGPVLAVINGVFGRSYRKHVAPVWGS